MKGEIPGREGKGEGLSPLSGEGERFVAQRDFTTPRVRKKKGLIVEGDSKGEEIPVEVGKPLSTEIKNRFPPARGPFQGGKRS